MRTRTYKLLSIKLLNKEKRREKNPIKNCLIIGNLKPKTLAF